MQKPHCFKRRHIQLQKVISQLESIIFSKRQLKKIYRDQDRLRQFRMKKNFTQQLNYDIQGIVKDMQTEDSKESAERLVNVNNSVSNCIKVRNEELKNMTTGIINLKELESEILSPDDKMITEITTSIELEETDEAVIEMEAPLQKSSCPDRLITVDVEESLNQKT